MNFLITPLDGVLTEITNDAAGIVNPDSHIDLAANLYFGIGSTIFITIVLTRRHGAVRRGPARQVRPRPGRASRRAPPASPTIAPELEARGLRFAGLAILAVLIVVALLTVIPGAPLRNPETGSIIGDSPLMDSLILIITIIFFAGGLAYGHGAGTLKGTAGDPRLDHEVLGLAGQPAVPVPADRAVHRLLQLLEHRPGRWRSSSATGSRAPTSAPSGC